MLLLTSLAHVGGDSLLYCQIYFILSIFIPPYHTSLVHYYLSISV